jgi:hypothetical protein
MTMTMMTTIIEVEDTVVPDHFRKYESLDKPGRILIGKFQS